MKAFFYLWCAMSVIGLIASFFNPSHIWFSCVPAIMMACAAYPDTKDKEDK